MAVLLSLFVRFSIWIWLLSALFRIDWWHSVEQSRSLWFPLALCYMWRRPWCVCSFPVWYRSWMWSSVISIPEHCLYIWFILRKIHVIISSQYLNLDGRRGTTDDIATITFHLSLSSVALTESPNSFPVHLLMWYSHLFFCRPHLLAPFTVPCRIFLTILSCSHTIWVPVSSPWLDHHALKLHSGFCCEPPRSSHGICRKCSEVSCSIPSQGLGSFVRILLSRSRSHMHKGRWIRWAPTSA